MMQRLAVQKGQRYVQRPAAHSKHVIWEVGAIKTRDGAIPHAHLVKVDDPLRCKTISCNTLADPSYYELLKDAPAPT